VRREDRTTLLEGSRSEHGSVKASIPGAARIPRGARRCVARIAECVRRTTAWRWGGPIARVGAAGLGLLVLAVIGRSATAGSPSFARIATADPPVVESAAKTPMAVGDASAALSLPNLAPPLVDAGDASSRGRATPDDPVYLNQATLGDLRRLPGVGPKRAIAILALRDRLQRFRQIEDLLKVKGIGRASLRKLRPLVRLDTPVPPNPQDAMPPPLSRG
jgi:competence protein ComEA